MQISVYPYGIYRMNIKIFKIENRSWTAGYLLQIIPQLLIEELIVSPP